MSDAELPPMMDSDLESPLTVANQLKQQQTLDMVRTALADRRATLAYQPVVQARMSNRTAFYEAFIRILDERGRVIPARDFMGAVETNELGRRIDCLALEMGLKTLAQEPSIRMSENMSERSIGYPSWLTTLERGLRQDPTIAERLILEITESSAMLVPEIVIAFMDDWQREGIAFALDDFGAGYTAIRYFRDFYFDVLKIDGQFIRNIHADRDNQVVTSALLAIGKQFDMMCVAEYVETLADATFLQALGVDCMQGYLFGAPTVKPDWAVQTSTKSA
jgi:EAL domain-containing protein (putative c-di-GMP-specific phosphodiesterase class I)